MNCIKCNYICIPLDHGTEGGLVWACDRCLHSEPVKPEDEESFWLAMKMQGVVECQLNEEEVAHEVTGRLLESGRELADRIGWKTRSMKPTAKDRKKRLK